MVIGMMVVMITMEMVVAMVMMLTIFLTTTEIAKRFVWPTSSSLSERNWTTTTLITKLFCMP